MILPRQQKRLNPSAPMPPGNIKDISQCFNQIIDYLERDITPRFAEFSEIAQGNNGMSVELQQIISDIKQIVDEFVDFVKTVTAQMEQIGEAAAKTKRASTISSTKTIKQALSANIFQKQFSKTTKA